MLRTWLSSNVNPYQENDPKNNTYSSIGVMKPELVAPCGMNCNLCNRMLDSSKPDCKGCRPRGRGCIHKKGLCEKLANQEIDFCYKCQDFPCAALLTIEERYNRVHNYSFVENLRFIQKRGMPAFLRREQKRYSCPSCSQLLGVHSDKCLHCCSSYPRKQRR